MAALSLSLLAGGVVPLCFRVLNTFFAQTEIIIGIKPRFFGWHCSLYSLGGGVPSSLSVVLLHRTIRTLSIRPSLPWVAVFLRPSSLFDCSLHRKHITMKTRLPRPWLAAPFSLLLLFLPHTQAELCWVLLFCVVVCPLSLGWSSSLPSSIFRLLFLRTINQPSYEHIAPLFWVVGSSPLLIFSVVCLNGNIRMLSMRPPLPWVAACPFSLLGGCILSLLASLVASSSSRITWFFFWATEGRVGGGKGARVLGLRGGEDLEMRRQRKREGGEGSK